MVRSWLRATVGILSLAWLIGSWAPAKAAAAPKPLPLGICLKQPLTVRANGQETLKCPRPSSTVPRHTVFYLLLSVTDPSGFQTYGLDWSVQRWQPKARRWASVRQEVGDQIQPGWQYVWLLQRGLAPGSYRAFVSTDFLAKLVDAPMFYFAASFKVH